MVGVSDIEWCCECENAPMEIKRFDERISNRGLVHRMFVNTV